MIRSDDLDRALGPTPEAFARRMDRTLLALKEDTPVKRFAFRTAALLTLFSLLACTTALALMSHGLEWYYNNRFTAYQENDPAAHEAIMANLQTEVAQHAAGDPQVNIAVTEVSWVADRQVLVVSVLAEAADPEHTELHPMWNLDADGSYVGSDGLALDPDDEEARAEHWLWTQHGFGPVADMVAPGKQLLLLDVGDVYMGEVLLLGDQSSADAYVTDAGAVHTVLELHLADAPHLGDALMQDEGGVAALRLRYTVTAYTEDDALLYRGGRTGEVLFEVNMR